MPVSRILSGKEFPAGHADHARLETLRLEQLPRSQGHADFRARRDDQDLRLPARGLRQYVGAAMQAPGRCILCAIDNRQLLACQRQRHRSLSVVKRGAPGLDRFCGVGRTDECQSRHGAQRSVVLHGLVRRAVFSQPDAVVCPDIDDPGFHDGGEAHAGAHVIGEDQEGRPVRNEQVAERDAVEDGSHPVLTHSKVEIPPGVTAGLKVAEPFDVGIGRRGEVRGPPDQSRSMGENSSQDLSRGFACCHGLGVGSENRDMILPPVVQAAVGEHLPFLVAVRVSLGIKLQRPVP